MSIQEASHTGNGRTRVVDRGVGYGRREMVSRKRPSDRKTYDLSLEKVSVGSLVLDTLDCLGVNTVGNPLFDVVGTS